MAVCMTLSCASYDQLFMYGPLYTVPLRTPLQFDGYYYSTNPPKEFNSNCPNGFSVMFFYHDGTVMNAHHFCNHDDIRVYLYNIDKDNYAPYDWGMYDYKNDTLLIEGYTPGYYGENYRTYLRGVFSNDTLNIFQKIDRDWYAKNIHFQYCFRKSPNGLKPDSSKSIFRKWPKYKEMNRLLGTQ